jgi:replicative DNA helicase
VNTLPDSLPPHSIEAERRVIGACLRDPEALDAAREKIAADDFYQDAHQRIFRAICDLAADGKPVDLVLLYERLKARGELADVGGAAYIGELHESTATGAGIEHYAGLVLDASLARSLIHAANETLRDAHARHAPAAELVAEAEQRLFSIGDAALLRSGSVRSASELMREATQRIDDRAARGGGIDGLETKLRDLDWLLGGLKPGQLIVVGGRPGGGKTALGLTIATNVASAGVPVFFASMEMPALEIADRMLAQGSGVGMHVMRGGRVTDEEAGRINRAAARVGNLPVYVDDTPDQSAARLAAVIRREKRRRNIGLAVVDYLQLMRPENPRENRTQQVGQCARDVKRLARRCGIPVILLSQLNRGSETEGRKPRLSDLRESGEIEQHADAVVLVHIAGGQDNAQPTWAADAIVAKNRNGPIGDVLLTYQRPTARFRDAVPGSTNGAAVAARGEPEPATAPSLGASLGGGHTEEGEI